MAMWNREGRDLGDRARELASRAGHAVRRGFDRIRGEDDEPMGFRGGERDWARRGEYGRWYGRHPRSDLGDQHRTPFIRNRDERDLTYRGNPGGNVHGGMREGWERTGWGASGYDREFGRGGRGSHFDEGPFGGRGAMGRREDFRSRRGMEWGDPYDREMRGEDRFGGGWGEDWERGWRGGRGGHSSGWGWRDRDVGMTPGWREAGDRGFDEYGGYSQGLGEEPFYGRDDFRGSESRYDRGFRDDDRDWF